MARHKKYLGEMLVEAGIITNMQLEEALDIQRKTTGKRLGTILRELNYADDQIIMSVLEAQLGVPFIDLSSVNIPQEMIKLVPVNIAKKHKLIPIKVENDLLYVAMEDPFSFLAIEDVRRVARMEVKTFLAKAEQIMTAIEKLYSREHTEKALKDLSVSTSQEEIVDDVSVSENDVVGNAPVVRLVNSIIEEAINTGASDIHIEPMEDIVRVRNRTDGTLRKVLDTPKYLLPSIIARIKIMGAMNIAEKRVPQDGRTQVHLSGKEIDIRISTLPTIHGEKAVMRLLDRSSFLRPKAELGFTKKNDVLFEELLHNPHGIILVTGPTGSGKSTTLYTMLSELNKEKDNIITVEDPVEYQIAGLNQVHVNMKAGLDFPTALKSILRQDPDIIMIGEIRDSETVEIATRAAITGHLVLSTIHTNDSVSTISRLSDMGIEEFMLAASLVGIIAQRLVKLNCKFCSQPIQLSQKELDYCKIKDPENYTFTKGVGCPNCSGTGMKGRTAVHEVLMIDRHLRDMISNKSSVDSMRDYAVSKGLSTLQDECIRLLKEGRVTIDEVYRVAYSGE
ncbi:MAG: type II/IV secretion system protein [Clostridia bacterium]|nr:type II/IV secretion system protein [Clostridia bacterium]